MAVLTTALTRLRSDFNTRFPDRDHASDGWIGDARHQEEISGHNPDETGGGEYEDADSKDEVRAIDVDVDFREPGVNAQMVVDAVLDTPADLKRLRYIIYNRRIWSRNTDWKPKAYTGSNPHDKHIHFSGDPLQDENAGPFNSILYVGGVFVALTAAQQTEMYNLVKDMSGRAKYADGRLDALVTGSDAMRNQSGFPAPGEKQWEVTTLKSIAAAVAALATGDAQRAAVILAEVQKVDEEVVARLEEAGDDLPKLATLLKQMVKTPDGRQTLASLLITD